MFSGKYGILHTDAIKGLPAQRLGGFRLEFIDEIGLTMQLIPAEIELNSKRIPSRLRDDIACASGCGVSEHCLKGEHV